MTLPLGLLVEAERAAPGLAMPDQDLSRPFRDPAAPGTGCAAATRGARAFVVLVPAAAAILLALALVAVPADAPRPGWATWVVALLSAVAFWGIAHSAATAALGPLWRPGAAAAATATGPATGLDVAILVPMYGEPAAATIGRAVALLARLGRDSDGGHRFSLHILSDTRDDRLATFERAVVRALRQAHPGLAIGYRRRPENRDYKSGNLRDWIQQAGNRHDAALLLDADSVLSAGSARALADALSADPGAALIQAVPRVLAGRTLWQRLQSFASEVYGRNIGRGFALWTGAEANFFGHNAIIRLAAFAAAAGLPHLPGARPRGGVILSHDFVEAALLRRAGWGVRILPEAARTFEEAPPTLPAHFRRDRRWCQGNLQHLRLLATPGLHPLSRFHLLQGALSYLNAPIWLLLILLLAAPGAGVAPAGRAAVLTGAICAALLLPRLIGFLTYLRLQRLPPALWPRLTLAVVAETLVSALAAPVQMLHQIHAIAGWLLGRDGGWQPHDADRPPLRALLRFHAAETGLGLLALGLIGAGALTVWAFPVALGLAVAVPLSALAQRPARARSLFNLPGDHTP